MGTASRSVCTWFQPRSDDHTWRAMRQPDGTWSLEEEIAKNTWEPRGRYPSKREAMEAADLFCDGRPGADV